MKARQTLVVVMDGDFTRTNGAPSSNRNHYEIFGRRYTQVFDDVRIMCRVHDIEDPAGKPIAGPGVEVSALPPLHGHAGLIKYGCRLIKEFWSIPSDATIILRVPGIYPTIAWPILLIRRLSYGVEVMADAAAQFAPGAYRRPFRRLYGFIWTQALRIQCRYAGASSYVTRSALQEMYPPKPGTQSFSYTTLDLPKTQLAGSARALESFKKRPIVFINVAMMQKHLKGQDIIIAAVAELKRRSFNVELWLVGDGDTRALFEDLARQYDVTNEVKFLGKANAGDEVFSLLDRSDIFLLPSRQEGLPRVVIEAMARALPCFSSNLPGNRELLSGQYLVDSEDPNIWADRISATLSRPELLVEASAQNISRAADFVVTNVQPVRNAFYQVLRRL